MSESDSFSSVAAETGAYYDRLERWTSFMRFVGYGGGRQTLTVHRALADPRTGKASPARLHSLLFESLPRLSSARVLDAGCGLGGTMLDLALRTGGHFTGVTLSPRQAAIGRRALARAGLSDRVDISVGSYDDPPAGTFNVIYGIESLAHSQDPMRSLRALASRLSPGGCLLIVDDMPEPEAAGNRDLAVFRRGWRLPVLWGVQEYRASFRELGLTVTLDRDLTPEVIPRSAHLIAGLEALNRLIHHLCWSAGLRQVLNSYHGGLALERLYRNGLVKYRMLMANL